MEITINIVGTHVLFGGDLARTVDFAVMAEEKGADRLAVADHVVMGEATQDYPYGPYPMPLDFPWLEPLMLLAAVASHTKRALLTSGIIISPLRPAVLLAKQIATLDVLSNGRAAVGLGVGWQKAEYDASGVPWEGRFGYLIEQMEVCRTLWRGAPASFKGKHVSFERLHAFPLPPQGDRMPILLGLAPTEINIRRIVKHAAGWLPMERDPEKLAGLVTQIKAAAEDHGRDPATITIQAHIGLPVGPVQDWNAVLDHARKLRKAGVTVLQFTPASQCQTFSDAERYLDEVAKLKEKMIV